MKYNSKSHETNNHHKHSLKHAYAHDNAYLGEISTLDVVSQDSEIVKRHQDAIYTRYNSETGQTTVYGLYGKVVAIYENIYAQQIVILGMVKVS